MNYAIIDVETTGMGVQGNKITEIAVLVHDGEKVIDEFQTLVNPQCSIPFSISRLTGIYDHMVKDAPKFYEIAKNLVSITEDCVFVAHNVNFDYNVIRKEFSDLGFNYVRKKLCTIRLSRKLVPGLPSYSLGKICGRMGIRINDRHRAMGDARATAILFDKLIQLDQHGAVFESFLKPRSPKATLPPQISVKMFEALPESPGVYYFRDNKDKIIYVGGLPEEEYDVEHMLDAMMEQSRGAPNIVALKPGVVIAYKRNKKTNQELRDNGIKVIEWEDSYLDLLGGPHCSTCPLWRD